MEARKREEHNGLRGLSNNLHPHKKTLVATSLMYTQVNYYSEPNTLR